MTENKKPRKRPNGYWGKVRVERALQELSEKLGHFPAHAELRQHGLLTLRGAMRRTGGIRHWMRVLGNETSAERRQAGYFDDRMIIERELRQLCERLGHFPSRAEINLHNLSSVRAAMQKTGGVPYWRRILGYDAPYIGKRYWQIETNIASEIAKFIAERGTFPSGKDSRCGYSSLVKAMGKTGGISAWRARFGFQSIRRSLGYWNEASVEKEVKGWIEDHGSFPTSTDLAKDKNYGLVIGIGKTGGFPFWRAKLGYGPITPECLREHADALARVVMALDIADTAAFWAALQERWTMHELTEAIREYTEEGKLERFPELLTAAD